MRIETTLVYEADDDGLSGGIMGIYLDGHHDEETAVAVAWAELDDYEALGPVKHPVRCYVRKVPQAEGWTRFAFTRSPGRGASPVTLVELAPDRRPKCFLCPWESVVSAAWYYLWEDAFASVPKDMEQVPLCREHGTLALGYALGENGLVNA